MAGLKPLKHVQNVLFLPPRKGPLANATIKWALTTYGAVEVGMYIDPATSTPVRPSMTPPTAPTTAPRPMPPTMPSNRGWDNAYPASNFTTTPPGNGAFLVRNSWGSLGRGGYFWVSYYDAGSPSQTTPSLLTPSRRATTRPIYQYDPLGWTKQAAIGYSTNTAWFANRFKARKAQHLRAVSFYSSAAGSRYRIYASLGSPSSKRLVASGTLAWPGYHTVRLTKPLGLLAGHFFSVAVRLVTPGSRYPIPSRNASRATPMRRAPPQDKAT